jgi:hypothetical protein
VGPRGADWLAWLGLAPVGGLCAWSRQDEHMLNMNTLSLYIYILLINSLVVFCPLISLACVGPVLPAPISYFAR